MRHRPFQVRLAPCLHQYLQAVCDNDGEHETGMKYSDMAEWIGDAIPDERGLSSGGRGLEDGPLPQIAWSPKRRHDRRRVADLIPQFHGQTPLIRNRG